MPVFANLFAIAANQAVTQIVFKNQTEPNGAIAEVAHVVTSTTDAIAMAKLILELAGEKVGVQ